MPASGDFASVEGDKLYDFGTYSVGDDAIDAELDQLVYSAYLLTLDSDKAFSAVMEAAELSLDDSASHGDLLRRIIDISLVQLGLDTPAEWDRESSAVEALLYSESNFARSKTALFSKEQANRNPILLLDSGARISFVLHHVLGYSINEAAALVRLSEQEFGAQLRKAYLQLASLQLGTYAIAGDMLGPIARA